jgi:bifunctional non-homologous end joining protein LigD
MLATLIDAPFNSRDWVFETKWDGFRLVARIENGRVALFSRGGLIVNRRRRPGGDHSGARRGSEVKFTE